MEHEKKNKWKKIARYSGWAAVTVTILTGIVKITFVLAESTTAFKDTKQELASLNNIVLPGFTKTLQELHQSQELFYREQIVAHQRLALKDSLDRVFQLEVINQLRSHKYSITRLEKYLKLPPTEWDNIPIPTK